MTDEDALLLAIARLRADLAAAEAMLNTQEPKTHAPKPARTDENKQPTTEGFLHGLSEQAHQQFLAFQKRFGDGTGEDSACHAKGNESNLFRE